MPYKCFVPLCKTGYASEIKRLRKEGRKGPSSFRPSQENLLAWRRKIPRQDKELQLTDYVCELHFSPEDVLKHYEITLPSGEVYTQERGRYTLRSGAIPTIFPGPKYLSTVPKKRPPPKARSHLPPVKREKKCDTSETSSQYKDTKRQDEINIEEKSEPARDVQLDANDNIPIPVLFDDPCTNEEAQQKLQGSTSTALDDHSYSLQEKYTITDLHNDAYDINLPGSMWAVHSIPGKMTGFVHCNTDLEADKTISFIDSTSPKIIIKNKVFDGAINILKKSQLQTLLSDIHSLRLCVGVNNDGELSQRCKGYVEGVRAVKHERCLQCTIVRRSRRNRQGRSLQKDTVSQRQKYASTLKTRNQRVQRLKKRVQKLRLSVEENLSKMKKMSNLKFEECIATLPPEQHVLVKTCFDAAKAKNKNGRRYTMDWVYECLLMKIKSPKLYRKLRRENKLPLPHECTLRRYIKKLQPAYGFQESTFHLLREKASHFTESERHGCLLFDEMALEEGVTFQRDSLEVLGFVDLGQHTPDSSKGKRGNHALVVMYQPFKGKWFQTIGAFLSAGAVPGKVLEKIAVEAIILLENEGYHVDNVTTDGATWNRTMWEMFGISIEKSCCQHPLDPKRNLWFASDFPHLIKNLWTRIVNKKSLNLPEGTIKLSHWEAVLTEDTKKGVKACHTLENAHIAPTNYQRMNSNLAIRFFGHSVAAAMEYYRQQGVYELHDCQATVVFIERMNAVIEAMNSRKPWEALICDPETVHYKTLTAFLSYLDAMADMAANKRVKADEQNLKDKKINIKKNHPKKIQMGDNDEFTLSTYVGFVVTVRTAIQLVSYLKEEVGYSYLMTRRINQDALEHFFGEMRGACGASTHPDPLMFIQVYRLISTYSLVKPPRGSNVSGGELLTSLISIRDITAEKNLQHHKDLQDKIERIIDNTEPNFSADYNIEDDHTYLATPIDPNALTVFAGYVARKMMKTRQCRECDECTKSIHAPKDADLQDRENLLSLKSYGGLIRPSDELFSLLLQLEESITKNVVSERLTRSTLFSILEEILDGGQIARVGCQRHEKKLTYDVVSFYLMCRMHFVCAAFNKSAQQKKDKKRNMAKLAKF